MSRPSFVDASNEGLESRKYFADLAVKALGISFKYANAIVCFFSPNFYRSQANLPDSYDDHELFDHYLNIGIYDNLSPGPLFNPTYVIDELQRKISQKFGLDGYFTHKDKIPKHSMLAWIELESRFNQPAIEAFDNNSYFSDDEVQNHDESTFLHFLLRGQFQGRALNLKSKILTEAIKLRSGSSSSPVVDILSLFPDPFDKKIFCDKFWEDQNYLFQLNFYNLQNNDVISDVESGWSHFLGIGAFSNSRPTLFYNDKFYKREWKEFSQKSNSIKKGLDPSVKFSGYMHWLNCGRFFDVSPTSLFDEALYRESHNDIKHIKSNLFDHFLRNGCKEKFRIHSEIFNAGFYLSHLSQKLDFPIPLVDFVIRNRDANLKPSKDIATILANPDINLTDDTPLEKISNFFYEKKKKLNSPHIRALIDRAAFIEPLIFKPAGHKKVQYPPIKHSLSGVVEAVESIRADLKSNHYHNIVLIPHVRLSGAARVAGELVKALSLIDPINPTLLIITDLAIFENEHWFSGCNLEVLYFFNYSEDIELNEKVLILMDLLRGLNPHRIININSQLCWKFYEKYARQFSSWTKIFAYLFTWDLDKFDNKVGYPILEFQNSYDYLDGVLIDNTFLAEELSERYMLPSINNNIFVIHTPADNSSLDLSCVFKLRRSQGRRLRAFWCGRFDAQKRFDIVIEIARLLPDLQIYVWGKSVLNNYEVEIESVPKNILFQGIYESFDDLPLESCDFLLYTSAWDGLPTLLIDAGMRGIPIVASLVGGVKDLIDQNTGWPIYDYLDPTAYVDVISGMQLNPEEVARRAVNLKKITNNICSKKKFNKSIRKVLYG